MSDETQGPSPIETYLNSLQVEQGVTNIILMHLLRHLIGSSGDPAAAYHRLRRDVLASIELPPDAASDTQGLRRIQAMQRMSAEDTFDRIAQSIGLDKTNLDPSA